MYIVYPRLLKPLQSAVVQRGRLYISAPFFSIPIIIPTQSILRSRVYCIPPTPSATAVVRRGPKRSVICIGVFFSIPIIIPTPYFAFPRVKSQWSKSRPSFFLSTLTCFPETIHAIFHKILCIMDPKRQKQIQTHFAFPCICRYMSETSTCVFYVDKYLHLQILCWGAYICQHGRNREHHSSWFRETLMDPTGTRSHSSLRGKRPPPPFPEEAIFPDGPPHQSRARRDGGKSPPSLLP